MNDTEAIEHAWTDEELAELALTADPDAPFDVDAVPFRIDADSGTLPAWYMPSVTAGASRATRRRKLVVVAVVVALLGINAAGLCVTYGAIVLG
jgi:hypothetical protein